MPHDFFTGFRVFFEVASSALALKLLRDVYFDRSNLSELWKAPRRYHSARVFRVTGLLAALIGVVTHVDFYGVFGIMDPHVVEGLLVAAWGLLLAAIYVTIYHELIATLPFFGVENFAHPHRLQAALSVNCVIHYSYILTFFVENRVVFVTLSGMAVLYASVMLVVVNAMYLSIRRHHNKMRKARLNCYVGKSSHSWNEILRKWRIYVVILSVFLLTAMVWVLYELLHPSRDALAQNSVNLVLDPNEPPHERSVMMPVALLVITCGAATRSTSRPKVGGQPLHDRDIRSNTTKSSSAAKAIATSHSAQSPSTQSNPNRNTNPDLTTYESTSIDLGAKAVPV